METLGADADDSQINGEPVAGAHLPDKMGMVFEIHGPRSAPAVVGVAEPDSRIEFVAGIVEHSHEISDVDMIVAICPFGARDRLVTRRPQFPNLFWSEMRWLQRSISPLP